MDEAESIRAGFICPFCMADLGNYQLLVTHVESEHPEGNDLTESVVQNVKGFFDKAKRGIKKLDARVTSELSLSNSNSSSNLAAAGASAADTAGVASTSNVAATTSPPSVDRDKERAPSAEKAPRRPRPIPPDVIPMGVTRTTTDYFKSCRDQSINETANRTNMLIIRLDRLIHYTPRDPNKRKEFEREVVPWLEDSEVICCPLCAAKFGLTRRRHHCRLCGRVMCHACSKFLGFLSARKLTNPALAHRMMEAAAVVGLPTADDPESSGGDDASPANGRRKLLEMTQNATGKVKTLFSGAVAKATDDSSVNSLLQQSEPLREKALQMQLVQDASECLRLCGSCLTDLQRREQMMDQSNTATVVEQYATLHAQLAELTALVPTYVRIANSINNGETMYTLKAAEEMRQKVAGKQKGVDLLSKRIADDGESEACGVRERQMRRNIRGATLHSLQGLVAQMMPLPSAEEFEQLQERHRREVARQVAEARERAANVANSSPSMGADHRHLKKTSSTALNKSPPNSRSSPANGSRSFDDGWTPSNTKSYNPFLEEDSMMHPMFEQRDILKGYLEQAASAGRLDEVEMLERSLTELEAEMRNMGLETPR